MATTEDNVAERLNELRKAIQKATKDTLRNANASGLHFEEDENNDDDPNASFHLGVELFGQEISIVEENTREKLASIENELSAIKKKTSLQPDDQQAAANMENRIEFLRQCSLARSFLDQSLSLSTPSLTPEIDLRRAANLQVQAQQAVKEAQTIVSSESNASPSALAAANKILDSLRSAVRRQKVDLLGEARKIWAACVSLSATSLIVRSPTDLPMAYDVLQTFADDGHSALQDILRKFTTDLHTLVYCPLLERLVSEDVSTLISYSESEDSGVGGSLMTSTTLSTAKTRILRLEWNTNGKQTGSLPSGLLWKNTIDFVQKTMVYITEHILLERLPLCRLVGSKLFGRSEVQSPEMLSLEVLGIKTLNIGNDNGIFRELLIDTLEKSSIPTHLLPEELGTLKTMASDFELFLSSFHDVIISLQLVSNEGIPALSSFATNFEKKYVEKRRCTILNEARTLLLNNDYHNTVEVGVDAQPDKDDKRLGLSDGMAVFQLQECSISDTAAQIMKLCRRTMDEAVAQTSASLIGLQATLYRTAREILELFRAIIPVTHGHEISHVPRTAAILHNDCVFLAHNCLSLGLEYRELFVADAESPQGSLLQQTCVFVDMVPLFRDLAERSMGEMLDLQAKQIVELVGNPIAMLGESLRSDDIVSEWSDAEAAVAAGLYHLGHLNKAWRPILSYDVLTRSIGYLSDVLFSLLLDQIMKASDISTSACQFVNTQFEKVAKEVNIMTEGDKAGSQLMDRFTAIGRFMDMSLADIGTNLSEGLFRSISAPELSKLVLACFNDSPNRRKLLKLLSIGD